ncbi:MAG: hypothetical protein E6K92_08480 [Thaumarchaeota archaeon]|nr:MAG: hypothetical protein E6K92_08480 [Nitrososphaerota archaeon]
MPGKFADEMADMHPRSWLSKYRRTSVGYLAKMLLFYHGIGFGLLLVGSPIIGLVMPDYKEPSIPRSVAGVLVADLLFVLPSLFFSLRTWVSGKGWFSVVTHSAWNGVFFAAGCSTIEFTCTPLDNDISSTLISVALSAGLIAANYALYKRKESKERKRLAA